MWQNASHVFYYFQCTEFFFIYFFTKKQFSVFFILLFLGFAHNLWYLYIHDECRNCLSKNHFFLFNIVNTNLHFYACHLLCLSCLIKAALTLRKCARTRSIVKTGRLSCQLYKSLLNRVQINFSNIGRFE